MLQLQSKGIAPNVENCTYMSLLLSILQSAEIIFICKRYGDWFSYIYMCTLYMCSSEFLKFKVSFLILQCCKHCRITTFSIPTKFEIYVIQDLEKWSKQKKKKSRYNICMFFFYTFTLFQNIANFKNWNHFMAFLENNELAATLHEIFNLK